jgi:TP901 family phage tail tape measure protein
VSYNLQLILSARDANLGPVLGKASGEVRGFGREVDAASKKTESAGTSMKTKLAVGGVAVAAALGYAVKSAAEFDSSMHNVNSLMGLNEKQFKSLERQVLSLSTRLPQSSTELAKGLYEISSSGFTGAKGLDVLKSAATAASAGLTDTETSADAIVGVLHSYGLQASDSKEVSDKLFQSVNLGVLSFHDLAQGIGNVVPMAAAAKVPLNDVLAAIDTMTRTGIKAPEAFTSLNQVITKLLNPTTSMQKAFHTLGYESGASALQSKGLAGVLSDLTGLTGGSADATVKLFGDVRAARGAFALGAQDGKLYNNMIKQQGEYAGQTQKVLAEQSKSASYQYKLLKNDVQNAAIVVGTALLPYLVKGAAELQKFFTAAGHGSGGLKMVGHDVLELLSALMRLGGAVQHELAPLEKLALGATIAGLDALARALTSIANFASQHAGAVAALVGGLAALKVAGTVSAGMRGLVASGGTLETLGLRLLYARDSAGQVVSNVRNAEGGFSKLGAAAKGAGSAVRTAGSSMLAAVGGPLGALTLLVGAAAAAWLSYESKQKSAMATAEQQGKQLLGSTNFWDPKAAQSAIEGQVQVANSMDKSTHSASLWSKAMNVLHVGSAVYKGDLKGAAGAAGATQQNIEDLTNAQTAYNRVGQQMGQALGLTTSQIQKLSDQAHVSQAEILLAGNSFDHTKNKALEAATGFHSVSEAQADIQKKLQQQLVSNAAASTSTAGVTAAMTSLADATQTAADRATALSTALTGLTSPGTELQQSVQGWEDAIRSAVDTAAKAKGIGIDPLTHAFHTQSEAGKNAAKVMNDMATGMSGVISKMAAAGAPTSQMNEVLAKTKTRFTEAGRAAGLTQPQIDAYAKTLGIVPATVTTLIKQYGVADAKSKTQGLVNTMTKVPKAVRTQASVLGAHKSAADLELMFEKGQKIPKGVSTSVSVPGSRNAALELVNVARKANGLPALKRLPVTTPGINSAINLLGSMKSAVEKVPGHKASDVRVIDEASSVLRGILGLVNSVPRSKSSTITITTVRREITERLQRNQVRGQRTAQAYGGIMSFANGKLPGSAMIARDGANLVQWAEPGTGDEAFIPMARSRRERSTDILDEVADRFGYRLVPEDQVESYATGGTRRSAAYRARLARDKLLSRQRAARAAARAHQERRRQQFLAERAYQLEQSRLRQPVDLQSSLFDPSSALTDFTDQQETAAQNRAQAQANLAQHRGNTNATAADFYKAPRLMTEDYLKSFNAQLKNARKWEHDLVTIAHRAGSGVALQLQQMGASGEALVSKMAGTTETQTKRMAKALTDLAGTAHEATQTFQLQLRDSTAKSVQFNKDLLTLLARGDVSLVAKLQDLGVDQGYQIARQAVTERGRASSLEKDIKKNSAAAADAKLGQALSLATIITKHKDDIGIAGLAAESGMSVADVWVLLAQYNTKVFHHLTGKMDAIRRDQALVAAGRQISGLQQGGIVHGGASGMFYRWAEPGAKGESLIPHDPQNTHRARALWQETGRIIGATAARQQVRMVHVADGAVTMHLTVNGSNLTAEQVQTIAAQQTTAAVTQLMQKIRSA